MAWDALSGCRWKAIWDRGPPTSSSPSGWFQAKQIVVGRDQRKVHDLSSGGKEPIYGIASRQRELLGEQHDLVGQTRFPHGTAQQRRPSPTPEDQGDYVYT
jgi:hypothetical protein